MSATTASPKPQPNTDTPSDQGEGSIMSDGEQSTASQIEEPLTSASRRTSRLVLLSIWTVAIFLGLPLWIQTTWTERRALPDAAVARWEAKTRAQIGCPVLFPSETAQDSRAHPCVVQRRGTAGACRVPTRSWPH